MAHEIPSSDNFTGLSRKVMEYSERFGAIVESIKEPDFSIELWDKLEELVDVDNFVRQGVFLTETPETIDWKTYRDYITQYGGATHWEATLRHITEHGNRVILELQERNTYEGFTHIANTAMAYGFNDEGRVTTLDVYVMRLN
ncbi:MAG TPA: hypothetical protein VMS16_02170 [Mycobacterium sp.]|nr:hypothetical protein [Mycobacterium sp.]